MEDGGLFGRHCRPFRGWRLPQLRVLLLHRYRKRSSIPYSAKDVRSAWSGWSPMKNCYLPCLFFSGIYVICVVYVSSAQIIHGDTYCTSSDKSLHITRVGFPFFLWCIGG